MGHETVRLYSCPVPFHLNRSYRRQASDLRRSLPGPPSILTLVQSSYRLVQVSPVVARIRSTFVLLTVHRIFLWHRSIRNRQYQISFIMNVYRTVSAL